MEGAEPADRFAKNAKRAAESETAPVGAFKKDLLFGVGSVFPQ
jgi:hypothetical protein